MKKITFLALLIATLLGSQVASAQGIWTAPVHPDRQAAPYKTPDVFVTFIQDFTVTGYYSWPIYFYATETHDDRGQFMYTTFFLREVGESHTSGHIYWSRQLDCQVPRQGLIRLNREFARLPPIGLDASPSSTTCSGYGYRLECSEDYSNCSENTDPQYTGTVWLEAVWRRPSFFNDGTSTDHVRNQQTGEQTTQHCTVYASDSHLEGGLAINGQFTAFTDRDGRFYYQMNCTNVGP